MAVSRSCHTDPGIRSTEGPQRGEPKDGHRRLTRRAAVVALAGLLGAGCLGTPPAPTDDESVASAETTASMTSTPTETTKTPAVDNAKLADVLVGLVRADDRSAYAAEHRLDYRDGRVRVVVELVSGAELPADVTVDVVARGAGFIEGDVDPDDLPRLAASDAVAGVRPPRQAVPQSS